MATKRHDKITFHSALTLKSIVLFPFSDLCYSSTQLDTVDVDLVPGVWVLFVPTCAGMVRLSWVDGCTPRCYYHL